MLLGRNQDYLKTSLEINQYLVMNAGATGAMPSFLRPVTGTLFNLLVLRLLNRIKKWVKPLWDSRLETLKYDRDDPDHEEPHDLVQMMVRYAQRERPEELTNYDNILRRIVIQNFGSFHQTFLQVVNLILNVMASDAEFNTIAALREEADRVMGTGDSAEWTKAKVSQLSKADSCSRESIRLHAFGGRAVFRKVMIDGFETDDGYSIPKGTVISFFSQPVHYDGSILEDPARYDPFRYSRIREAAVTRDEKVPPVNLVSTSPEFLPFGHGKHACPGRFLIDFELKMILAYILRHYDLEFAEKYQGQRPPNYWLAEAVFPPDGVKIRVKRRAV